MAERTTSHWQAAGSGAAPGGGVVYYLAADHLGSTSLALTTSGVVTGTRAYYMAFGAERGPAASLPTDFTYTGGRASGGGLIHLGARFYDASLSQWIQPDTIIPDPSNPQAANRYDYVYDSPLKYTDPTGHVAEGEAVTATMILEDLGNYGVNVLDSFFGWIYGVDGQRRWNAGNWTLDALKRLQTGVHDLARALGGTSDFRSELGGISFSRGTVLKSGGETRGGVWIALNSDDANWDEWTVVHELAHAWDNRHGGNLSKGLVDYTGGEITYQCALVIVCTETYYKSYAGPAPKGHDTSFTHSEDWAESVAAYVYPGKAQDAITEMHRRGKLDPKDYYTIYQTTQRYAYVNGVISSLAKQP